MITSLGAASAQQPVNLTLGTVSRYYLRGATLHACGEFLWPGMPRRVWAKKTVEAAQAVSANVLQLQLLPQREKAPLPSQGPGEPVLGAEQLPATSPGAAAAREKSPD